MESIFTKIINGDIPCHKIAETEHCFSFLDIQPLREGHVLVIPKTQVDNIFNLDDELLIELHLFAKKISKAIEAAIPCERIGMAVIGLEVPHAHIHLIPISHVEDINFAQPKMKVSSAELEQVAARIREHIEA